ncbi:hypothetical protein glysoja_035477 [Glycine soja]|uniref:Uncharacterized protein n=1 Tax=Glycine soja TaxID=3848 RepID=A0A0B2R1R3_GLYSO|nr:hypothetical protein glysoja_035477 [Glycine soja]
MLSHLLSHMPILGFQLLGAFAPRPSTGTPSSTTSSSSIPVPPAYRRRYNSSKCAAKETSICSSVSSRKGMIWLPSHVLEEAYDSKIHIQNQILKIDSS